MTAYVWQKTPLSVYAPKFLLNGFPKAGLHLVEQMVRPIASPMPWSTFAPGEWVGTFEGHSWTNEWDPNIARLYWKLARLHQGRYYKGHLGWRRALADHCWRCGIAVVFIYRDLRDVAVSQAHHILDPDNTRFKHGDKSFFRKMKGGFDEVLMACIEGIGPYPGVMSRWAQYAGWMDEDWVLKLQFEDLRQDPRGCAEWLLQYGVKRLTNIFGAQVTLGEEVNEVLDAMAAAPEREAESATFRKGDVGEWACTFKAEHRAAFKASDTNNWLVRLGYEQSEDW